MDTRPGTYATREQFQAEIDALSDGDELELHAFEYPGPIVIRRAVTIDGNGATLWALQGPVCQIESQGVTLKNIKIEVTHEDLAIGDSDGGCALRIQGVQNFILDNVEVRGSVIGLPAEEGEWHYPYSIKLNEILHTHEHRFLLRLYVPVPCKLLSAVYGINVEPTMLPSGRNEVTLNVDSPAKGALLLGTLCLQSAFLKRQISVSGYVVQSAQPGVGRRDGEVLYEPADWDRLGPVQIKREISLPVQKPSVKQPQPPPPTPAPQPLLQPEPARRAVPTPSPLQSDAPMVRGPSRVSHSTIPMVSGVFGAPPPVVSDAGLLEPRLKLSSVFDSAHTLQRDALLDDTSSTINGADGKDRGSSGDGVECREAHPPSEVVAPQQNSARQLKKRTYEESRSLPLGAIFEVGCTQEKPEAKDVADIEGRTPGAPLAEISPLHLGRKSPMRPGVVSKVFFE